MRNPAIDLLKQAGFDVKGVINIPKNSSRILRNVTNNVAEQVINAVNAVDRLPIERNGEEYEDGPKFKKVIKREKFNTHKRIINELKEVYCGKDNWHNIY